MYTRYTPNGKNENGKITDQTVPTWWTTFSSRNIGSTSAALGISMTTSVTVSSVLRPRNFVSASP